MGLSVYYQNIVDAHVVCTSSTRPNPYEGLMIYETDTDRTLVYKTSWVILDEPWQTYTPTWTAATTAASIGNGTLAGYYRRQGNSCDVRVRISAGSTTSGGTGAWSFSAPFTCALATGQEEVLMCKLWHPGSLFINFVGFAYIGHGTSTLVPNFPISRTDTAVQQARNADASSAAGTGIPAIAGQYPLINGGNFFIHGSYGISQ